MTTAAFVVLAVCTGNVCRSPAIERLLRAKNLEGLKVASAGTRALEGQSMHPLTSLEVERLGGESQDFVARTLSESMVHEADLIVTAEPRHRSIVVSLVPSAHRRTFTLLEFEGIATALPDDTDTLHGRREVVVKAAMRRNPSSSRLAIPDPYGRSSRAHQRAVQRIGLAVEGLSRLLDPTALSHLDENHA